MFWVVLNIHNKEERLDLKIYCKIIISKSSFWLIRIDRQHKKYNFYERVRVSLQPKYEVNVKPQILQVHGYL